MSLVVHKTTFEVIELANTPDYMDGNWLINPILPNCEKKFWVLEGELFREMSLVEKEELAYSTESTIYLIDIKKLLTKQNAHAYENDPNAIINPIMLLNVPLKYTKVVDGTVVEMTQVEKDVVDLPFLERLNSKLVIQDTFTTAIDDLQQIQNVSSPTNAQIVAAVKRMAQIEEQLLRFIYRNFI